MYVIHDQYQGFLRMILQSLKIIGMRHQCVDLNGKYSSLTSNFRGCRDFALESREYKFKAACIQDCALATG